jgi:hypothetical protein
VNQPDDCIAKINQHFNANFQTRKFTSEENMRLKEVLTKRDEQQKRADLNSSLPNERKTELKMAIAPEIINHALYDQARAIFKEFIEIRP